MKHSEKHMPKATLTVEVSEKTKKRVSAAARDENRSEQEILARLIEEGLDADAYWKREIGRRLAVPRDERRYVSNRDMGRWVKSLGTDDPLPPPKATPRT
jgi:predicted transcriptional regulator